MDSDQKVELWQRFCQAQGIRTGAVPLFETAEGLHVVSRQLGRDGRLVLQRSNEMESMIISKVNSVLAPASLNEGLLYMMCWLREEQVLPLYIGKAGRYGRKDGNISANLARPDRDRSKFARWGSNYAYHLGELSAVACPGHSANKQSPKYKRWAERLFLNFPAEQPQLREQTYFWCTAWSAASPSIWSDFAPCSLAFQEYLLIGVAGILYPMFLLNQEGINRIESAAT
jgi:hypothetical protein